MPSSLSQDDLDAIADGVLELQVTSTRRVRALLKTGLDILSSVAAASPNLGNASQEAASAEIKVSLRESHSVLGKLHGGDTAAEVNTYVAHLRHQLASLSTKDFLAEHGLWLPY